MERAIFISVIHSSLLKLQYAFFIVCFNDMGDIVGRCSKKTDAAAARLSSLLSEEDSE
jgi:hypothetical protein